MKSADAAIVWESLFRHKASKADGVQLSFKVRPDGTVYDVRVKPGFLTTVGEVRLKEQAKRYVERIRFNALPKTAPQINQSGEIFINFTTQPKRLKFSWILPDYPTILIRFPRTLIGSFNSGWGKMPRLRCKGYLLCLPAKIGQKTEN